MSYSSTNHHKSLSESLLKFLKQTFHLTKTSFYLDFFLLNACCFVIGGWKQYTSFDCRDRKMKRHFNFFLTHFDVKLKVKEYGTDCNQFE